MVQTLLPRDSQAPKEEQRERATSIVVVHFSGITTFLLLVWLFSISFEISLPLSTYGYLLNIYAGLAFANALTANFIDGLLSLNELSKTTIPPEIRKQVNDILLGGVFLVLGSSLQLLYSIPFTKSLLTLNYDQQAVLFFLVSPILTIIIFKFSRVINFAWFIFHVSMAVVVPLLLAITIIYFNLPLPITAVYVVEFAILVSAVFNQNSYGIFLDIFWKIAGAFRTILSIARKI